VVTTTRSGPVSTPVTRAWETNSTSAAAAEAVCRALDAPDADRARAAIERCARERRDVALVNRAAAGQALGHMQASDPWLRARRRLALELAARTTRVGAWLDEAPYGPRYARQGPR
jgi:3-(3-hydroxy-phenyl)propionate hydroxylase